jgi:hypothetical protein
MNDIKAVKSDFSAPPAEIRCGVVERVAELNEHVQRHEQSEDVLATSIVYEGFDCDKGAIRWQGVVGRAEETHLFFQIPVVKNHTHRDDVRLGQRVLKEIAGGGTDTVTQPGQVDMFASDRFHRRQVEGNALEMRMLLRGFDAKQASGAADVTKSIEIGKVKLGRERLEIYPREASHRAHELFESRQFFVELLEHSAACHCVKRPAGRPRT